MVFCLNLTTGTNMGSSSKSSTTSTSQDYSNSFNTNVAQSNSGTGGLSLLSQGAIDATNAAYSYLSNTDSNNTTQTFDTANNQQYSLGANSPISGSASASGSTGSGFPLDSSTLMWFAGIGAVIFLFLFLRGRGKGGSS